jgi:hypothetical protein
MQQSCRPVSSGAQRYAQQSLKMASLRPLFGARKAQKPLGPWESNNANGLKPMDIVKPARKLRRLADVTCVKADKVLQVLRKASCAPAAPAHLRSEAKPQLQQRLLTGGLPKKVVKALKLSKQLQWGRKILTIGNPAELELLRSICQQHGLPLVCFISADDDATGVGAPKPAYQQYKLQVENYLQGLLDTYNPVVVARLSIAFEDNEPAGVWKLCPTTLRITRTAGPCLIAHYHDMTTGNSYIETARCLMDDVKAAVQGVIAAKLNSRNLDGYVLAIPGPQQLAEAFATNEGLIPQDYIMDIANKSMGFCTGSKLQLAKLHGQLNNVIISKKQQVEEEAWMLRPEAMGAWFPADAVPEGYTILKRR